MQNEPRQSRGFFTDFLISGLLILLGLGAGYFYAQSQPKLWKATAVFDAPKVAELGNYFSLYSTYQLVQNDGKADPNLETTVAESAYAEFKRALSTADLRRQFLTENAIVKQIADVHYQPLNETVNRLSEQLHFDEYSNTLSLTLVNPEQAAKILEQLIAFHRQRVIDSLNNELVAKWKFLFQNVKQSAEAKLGASWQGKYDLMRSVEPLDGRLNAYHLVQKPLANSAPEMPKALPMLLGIGAAAGLFLGLLIAFLRRR